MKRSEINKILLENIEFIDKMNFKLPKFAYFTPDEWEEKGHEYDEIRENMLGWDVTDYGHGDFRNIGLFLFTIRNGNINKPWKSYAEKLLISDEDQYSPMHFHHNKMEDIINRGGGNLIVEVYNATEDDQLADTDVTVFIDGHTEVVPAGTKIRLTPGESITLPQKRAMERYLSARFLWLMTITLIIVFMKLKDVFRPSKRTKLPYTCSATNILKLNNFKAAKFRSLF